MSKVSRREFLRALAVGVSAVTVSQISGGCTPEGQPVEPVPTQPVISPSATPAGETASPEASTEASAQGTGSTPSGTPDLAVARGGEPEAMVRAALQALGGIERFVPQRSRVIIKPNICVAYHSYEYAATTNPWVVGALVKMCFEAGAANVQVMDSPFGGTAKEAYAVSGIEEQVKANGGDMVRLSRFKYTTAAIPQGKDLREIVIYKDILDADVVINVPIAKHHNLAGLTMGMKNLMGVIKDRGSIHQNMGQRLADLTSLVRPALTVIDAVRILMANGPTGGDLNDVKKLDTVIASADILAADSYGATLFGRQPSDLDYIRAGAEMGLGRSDLENLRIEEIPVGA